MSERKYQNLKRKKIILNISKIDLKPYVITQTNDVVPLGWRQTITFQEGLSFTERNTSDTVDKHKKKNNACITLH